MFLSSELVINKTIFFYWYNAISIFYQKQNEAFMELMKENIDTEVVTEAYRSLRKNNLKNEVIYTRDIVAEVPLIDESIDKNYDKMLSRHGYCENSIKLLNIFKSTRLAIEEDDETNFEKEVQMIDQNLDVDNMLDFFDKELNSPENNCNGNSCFKTNEDELNVLNFSEKNQCCSPISEANDLFNGNNVPIDINDNNNETKSVYLVNKSAEQVLLTDVSSGRTFNNMRERMIYDVNNNFETDEENEISHDDEDELNHFEKEDNESESFNQYEDTTLRSEEKVENDFGNKRKRPKVLSRQQRMDNRLQFEGVVITEYVNLETNDKATINNINEKL
jgi:hypothetical protein